MTPQPPTTPTVSQTTTTSTLPRTGDNLSIYLTLGILIPIGLVLMMLAFLLRRRNARGAEIAR